MVGAAGLPRVTITPAPSPLVPAEAESSVQTVNWPSRRRMVWRHVSAVGGGSVDASLPSGNTFHCPLAARGHSRSVWRASLEDKVSGNLLVRALAVERQLGSLRRWRHGSSSSVPRSDSLGDDGPSRKPRQLVVGLGLQCSGLPPLSRGPQEGWF